ncbi:MAG: dephospho-CoA kinase [Deltaproteobacteria bacterium]|nr:MAG: dephospho-CoA kinase [Deltaproteobacteria bacterium]
MERHSTAVIGLTGGIASGKSTVAARWRERGVRVIDADQLAREVVAPGEPALDAIARTFGPEYLQADGNLDRKRLGARVFAEPEAVARLNAITHPAILARVGAELAAAHREGLRWVVYEAALILENQLSPGLSALVAVVSEPELQVARAVARDGLDEQLVRQRMENQTDNATRVARADLVIHNDGTREALLREADRVFDELVGRWGALSHG